MKKKVKIPVIVLSSVLSAVLITVIVLCSVIMRPMKSFSDYSAVRVTTASASLPNGNLTGNAEYKSKIDKNLIKKTGFSIMHATLEFVGNYGPEFEKTKNADDETVNKEVTVNEARAACAATDDSYMLELEFSQPKTFKVKKSTVEYDRLIMNVKSTDGELRWVTVYLYLNSKVGLENNPESQDYRIVPIRMRMNTSPLYIALGEIAADFKTA